MHIALPLIHYARTVRAKPFKRRVAFVLASCVLLGMLLSIICSEEVAAHEAALMRILKTM